MIAPEKNYSFSIFPECSFAEGPRFAFPDCARLLEPLRDWFFIPSARFDDGCGFSLQGFSAETADQYTVKSDGAFYLTVSALSGLLKRAVRRMAWPIIRKLLRKGAVRRCYLSARAVRL